MKINFNFVARAMKRFFIMMIVSSGIGILINIYMLDIDKRASAALGIVEMALIVPVIFFMTLLQIPIGTFE